MDFVKVELPSYYASELFNNDLLDFRVNVSEKTGEQVSNYREAEYNNMKFTLYDSGRTIMQGSIHKYFNNGLHNHNDFSLTGMQLALDDLENRFGFNLEHGILRNVEFGVNINLPFSTKLILDNLVVHGKAKYKDVSQTGGYVKRAEYDQYFIKVYDKAMQYRLNTNTLRFELQYKRMSKPNSMGFTSLKDLTKPALFSPVKTLLLDNWEHTILHEPEILHKPIKPQIQNIKLYQWKDPDYWNKLDRQPRYRQRKLFKEFTADHTKNYHSEIKRLLTNKMDEMITN